MVAKNAMVKIEELANRLDSFNNSQIVIDEGISRSKIMEFGTLILEAQKLGFNVEIPKDIVMNLKFGNKDEILVSFDCDNERAYVNTINLWEFINKRKRFKVI